MRKQELHPRTAVLNKSQKNHSKKARFDALAWLVVQFPKAFDNTMRIRPLKIRIMDDILAFADKAAKDGISKSKLREAVVLFTRRLDYLACLKAREMRIDLTGEAVAEVTEEEAGHAANKIKKRVEKNVRNARKLMAEKTANQAINTSSHTSHYFSKQSTSNHLTSSESYLPIYPTRAPSNYSGQHAATQPARASTVVVKHKTTRPYDPAAVARLKEKLGLSKDLEASKPLSNSSMQVTNGASLTNPISLKLKKRKEETTE